MIVAPKSYTVSCLMVVTVIGTGSPYWFTQNMSVVVGEHDTSVSSSIIIAVTCFMLLLFWYPGYIYCLSDLVFGQLLTYGSGYRYYGVGRWIVNPLVT